MAVTHEVIAVGVLGGEEIPLEWFSEKDSLTLKRGQWVTVDANGKLDVATGTGKLAGILAADAKNTTSDTSDGTPIVPCFSHVVFEAQVWHSVAASAITARSQLGNSFAIKVAAATDLDGIDIETAANGADQCNILRISKRDAVGDAYGRLQFVINAANSVWGANIAH